MKKLFHFIVVTVFQISGFSVKKIEIQVSSFLYGHPSIMSSSEGGKGRGKKTKFGRLGAQKTLDDTLM